MKELIETQETMRVSFDDTCGIVFVFHAVDFGNTECACVIIDHFWATRHWFRDSTSRRLENIDRNDHDAFSSQALFFAAATIAIVLKMFC